MTGGTVVDRWNVFFRTPPALPKTVEHRINVDLVNNLLERRRRRVMRRDVPYLLDPDGRIDPIINEYFLVAMRRGIRSGVGSRPRRLSANSAKAYAYDIRVFLNVLLMFGRSWRDLDEYDIDDIREWRMFGEENRRHVDDSSWERQSYALRSLYSYASRFGIPNPMLIGVDEGQDQGGGYVRRADIKWFDPAAFAQWRDVGLGGILPDGTENGSFRGRHVQRDMAFANALYRTGLRVQECGSVLLGSEWPDEVRTVSSYRKSFLADACAKGGRGRPYWIPAVTSAETSAYILGERAAAVGRGQKIYAQQEDRLIISQVTRSGALTVTDRNGVVQRELQKITSLTPADRRRLYWKRGGRLEPAMLWLNGDGRPRDHRSWNKTFGRANRRIEALGLRLAPMKPHYLRHSFALRWYVVARMLWDRRLDSMSEAEANDLRHEMGSHWILVQTLLGHRHPSTTMQIYLEPFQALDIEMILDHAADQSVAGIMANLFRNHPRVQGGVTS